MTQPSSVTMTFDTSLVDVQRSFSSTATNTSGSTGKENLPPPEESDEATALHGSPYKQIRTDELYEQWADTYDTDGNILQFVDDLHIRKPLDRFVQLASARSDSTNDRRLSFLDLGCGTARNTLKLLQARWSASNEIHIHAWDSSRAMLEVAEKKCITALISDQRSRKNKMQFATIDISSPANIPEQFNNFYDGLISTLVLEHIEIETFFAVVARVLKPGARALITNMHSDMGRLSRAGFRTASGERFKATSYVYTPAETVEAAGAAGLELVGEVEEASVDERMVEGGVLDDGTKVEKGAVDGRAKKWVGTTVWYGMMLRKI